MSAFFEFMPVRIVVQAAPLIYSVVLHEMAHGFAALAFGDQTAKRAGRLSFNPMRHVDWFGTVTVPLFLYLTSAPFFFGWAKPVPVDLREIPDAKLKMSVVSLAGPLTNLVLAVLGIVGFSALRGAGSSDFWLETLMLFTVFNTSLAVFNAFPLPPLDGGHFIAGILPYPLASKYMQIGRFGMLVLLSLLILPSVFAKFGMDFDPLGAYIGGGIKKIFYAILIPLGKMTESFF